MPIQTVNPLTNTVVKSFEELTEKAIEMAVVQAVKTFSDWKKTPYQHRADVLHKVAALMRKNKVADQIDTGMVFINHPTWTQADLPFGGTKTSGYGRELSEIGISEFVNKKLIRISELSDPL
jgi:acyl-CoA reductase-like NAD-dependent aldehyde dehydrogenase